jgi:hypothetical protein
MKLGVSLEGDPWLFPWANIKLIESANSDDVPFRDTKLDFSGFSPITPSNALNSRNSHPVVLTGRESSSGPPSSGLMKPNRSPKRRLDGSRIRFLGPLDVEANSKPFAFHTRVYHHRFLVLAQHSFDIFQAAATIERSKVKPQTRPREG